jgi:hypothetical protein
MALLRRGSSRKAVARQGSDSPEEVEILNTLPHCRHRLHAARRHPAPQDGLQTEAGFILGKDVYREFGTIARVLLGELSGQGGGELRHGLRAFFRGRAAGVWASPAVFPAPRRRRGNTTTAPDAARPTRSGCGHNWECRRRSAIGL